MDKATRQQIEHDCARIAYRFTHIIDRGNASEVAQLFTEQGVFEVPGASMNGREAIRQQFKGREGSHKLSRHVCTNMVIDVIDEDHAEGLCYMTLYKYEPGHAIDGPAPLNGPAYVGNYLDQYLRVEGEWKFSQRTAQVIFLQTAATDSQ